LGKILLFALLVVFAFLYLKARARDRLKGQSSAERARSAANTPSPASEPVVACARCGVHVPLSESVEASGKRYCGEEHRRLG